MVEAIVSILLALISAYVDYRQIKKKWGKIIHLNYYTRNTIRFVVLLLSAIIFSSGWFILLSLIYQYLIFWLLFDLSLNLFRSLPPLHIGSSSTIDKKAKLYIGEEGLFAIKVSLLVFTVIIWIILI